MKLQIKLKIHPGAEPMLLEVEQGATLEELAKQYQPKLPYRILAAKVNNLAGELAQKIETPCCVELLDMREPSANQIYQRSLSFIYLKAVYDVLGFVEVMIANSLNKGFYTDLKTKEPITDEQLEAIDNRMRELIRQDIPFRKVIIGRQEALDALQSWDYEGKAKLLEMNPNIAKVEAIDLDGMRNFFYGAMAPSTGYIEVFELRKYRRGVLLRFPEPAAPDRIPEYRDDKLLYNAFGEATKWCRLMDINFVADLNETVINGKWKEVIQISEALHEKKVAEIADMITQQQKRIVLIAGPSSSGKTTFAHRLIVQLRVNGLKPLYLGTDDYFVERDQTPRDENGDYNFENIDAIDLELFNENMNALLAGETVDLPTFDFREGSKIFGKRITKGQMGQPIVIEGIHGLNKMLTAKIPDDEKFKIYISPLTQLNIDCHNRISTTDARMLRRIVRDSQFRGYSAQHTIQLWPKVRAGEDQNIFPYNGEADVLFNSVHIYELAVLKKYAEPLLLAIRPDEPEYSEAVRMLRFLKFFKIIDNDSVIVNNSIIREFIGGSIFVD